MGEQELVNDLNPVTRSPDGRDGGHRPTIETSISGNSRKTESDIYGFPRRLFLNLEHRFLPCPSTPHTLPYIPPSLPCSAHLSSTLSAIRSEVIFESLCPRASTHMHLDMGDNQVWYSANVPADFPTHDEIVSLRARAGFNQDDVCTWVTDPPRFGVKYGKDSDI